MYAFKKLVSALIAPLSLCLEAVVLGIVLLRFTKRQRTGKVLIAGALGALALLSNNIVAGHLVRTLEDDFPPLLVGVQAPQGRVAEARWIVLLGAGHTRDPLLPPTGQLNATALARLSEAVRLLHRLPKATLVVSGGHGGEVKHADLVADAASSMGIAPHRIVRSKGGVDTEGEVQAIRTIVRSDTFVLVTSAAHMPRAVGLFRHVGLQPVPAPADRLAVVPPSFSFLDLVPTARALRRLEVAQHEYLGMLWAKLRGRM